MRFEREAELASRLDHAGICPIYEVGEDAGFPYIAMRYVEGESLARRIERAGEGRCADLAEVQLSADAGGGTSSRSEIMRVLALIEKAGRALHAAHEASVVHRDVKPGNLMVTPSGDCVVMDFGLARTDEGDGPTITLSGDVFGTPAYMSPEQLRGEQNRIDRRTDVWSLGVTLYESVTGQRPFTAPTREGLYRAILDDDPQDPRRSSLPLPADLWTVLVTALAKAPDQRYQTAADFADDLLRVRRREPIAARTPSTWTRFVRKLGQDRKSELDRRQIEALTHAAGSFEQCCVGAVQVIIGLQDGMRRLVDRDFFLFLVPGVADTHYLGVQDPDRGPHAKQRIAPGDEQIGEAACQFGRVAVLPTHGQQPLRQGIAPPSAVEARRGFGGCH